MDETRPINLDLTDHRGISRPPPLVTAQDWFEIDEHTLQFRLGVASCDTDIPVIFLISPVAGW